ncbi:MAG: NAD(P)-dependent oxidoreductase [Blastochloris sp.]|nr:NAD(P)-dependent oxidoreductase [Blastochloris sp.]
MLRVEDFVMPHVLLTGASGKLGSHLRQWFGAHGRNFLATDIVPADDGSPVEIADLADRAAVDQLMAKSISAVVHFGGMAREAAWRSVLDANIIGTYNVFEAARQAGIKRIIFASSYHVQGMYPTSCVPIDVTEPYRPDTLYGVSKVFGETLSRLYFDKFGIECLVIRICAGNPPAGPREARIWVHRDDLASLVDRGIDMPELGHRTIYGISDNPNAFYINTPDPDFGWLPGHGSLELGTPDPRMALDPNEPRNRLTGGTFAQWGHFDDESPR